MCASSEIPGCGNTRHAPSRHCRRTCRFDGQTEAMRAMTAAAVRDLLLPCRAHEPWRTDNPAKRPEVAAARLRRRSISVGISNAGARDERDAGTGIAHMLEHMAFKGMKRRSHATSPPRWRMKGYNAHTSREETAIISGFFPNISTWVSTFSRTSLPSQRCPTRRST